MTENISHTPTTRPVSHSSRRIIRSLKAKADAKRTWSEKLADWMVATFGSVSFLAINVIWFATWLFINSGFIPSIEPFDPYPFGLLTTIVSLEAIILATFVLISQNRLSKIDDLREEIDLQVDIITEQELTKALRMLSKLLEKNGVDMSKDEELAPMLDPIHVEKIEKALERQVGEKSK